MLTDLNLRNNSIGSEGAKSLATALSSGSAVLKIFVLSYNAIEDEGAIAIGESLKTNSTLETLQLEYCSIGVEGGKAIGACMLAGITMLTNCRAP